MNNKGQSLFEVLLALFIITLVLVTIVILATNSIVNSTFSKNKTIAGKYTQEAIEWLRKEKEIDFSTFKTYAQTSKYCLDSLGTWSIANPCPKISDTIFTRTVEFEVSTIGVLNKTLITAEVSTTWNDSKGLHESRSVTNFTDNREQ